MLACLRGRRGQRDARVGILYVNSSDPTYPPTPEQLLQRRLACERRVSHHLREAKMHLRAVTTCFTVSVYALVAAAFFLPAWLDLLASGLGLAFLYAAWLALRDVKADNEAAARACAAAQAAARQYIWRQRLREQVQEVLRYKASTAMPPVEVGLGGGYRAVFK